MKEFIIETDMDLSCVAEFTVAEGVSFKPRGELIRCKDCKYWYQDFEGKCIASTPYGTDTDEDDFCSRAERKEE